MQTNFNSIFYYVLACLCISCSQDERAIDELVSDVASNVAEVEITVNIEDGFNADEKNDTYLFKRSGEIGYLSYNDESPVSVSEGRVSAIMDAIGEARFHNNKSCEEESIDGSPMPPRIVLKSDTAEYGFSVSDYSCAESDHSAIGNVISCVDYQKIMSEIKKAINSDKTFDCQEYW